MNACGAIAIWARSRASASTHWRRDRSEPFARAFDAAQVFARGKDRDAHWLFLWGEHGKGKTALGVALANERISHGLPALYVVVPDLLDHLRAAYQADAGLPYPRLFEQVRNAPFLILDDLDATNLTPWADEKLFQLLNHRANTGLLTVVLSSRHPNALEGSMRSLVQRVSGSEVVGLDGGGEAAGRYREIGGMTEVHLRQFTFETFRLDGLRVSDEEAQNLDLVRNMAQKWAQEPEGWFTLIGETGTGKTHLAAAIAHEQVERGADVFFAVVPDLLDYLRRAYHPTNPETYDDVFDALRETRLLILDDLGAHSTTAWAREKLYQLFSYRYIQALPTVITTNHNLEDLDPRLASRMADHQQTRVWRITARDYRTGATPRSVRDAAPKRRPSSWDKPRW